jgi:hypothetical protein
VSGLALAVSAAGLAAGRAQAAQASTANVSVSWRVAWSGSHYGAVLAVTAPAKNSAWAIGAIYHGNGGSFLVRWNGRQWREHALPVRGYQPYAIASSSANDVWLFGVTANGTAEALSWNGRRWIRVIEPAIGRTAVTGVAVLGPADVWMSVSGANDTTVVYHDLGGGWSESLLPASFGLGTIGGTSDRNMWVAGPLGPYSPFPGKLAVYRWTGHAWRGVRLPRPTSGSANILAESAKSVWIVSSDKVLHWNGSRLTEMANGDSPTVGPLAPFGANGLWVSAYELWTGSAWITVLPYQSKNAPVFDNGLAHIQGTDQTWLAGDSDRGAVIMKSTG